MVFFFRSPVGEDSPVTVEFKPVPGKKRPFENITEDYFFVESLEGDE